MIIETNFGTKVDPQRMAIGSATNTIKKGAFYVLKQLIVVFYNHLIFDPALFLI